MVTSLHRCAAASFTHHASRITHPHRLVKRVEAGDLAPALAHDQESGRAARSPYTSPDKYPHPSVQSRNAASGLDDSTGQRFNGFNLAAFTLIELLVVFAIIGLLSALVVGLLPRA